MSTTVVPATPFTAPVVTIQGEREGMEVTIPAEAATLDGFRNWAKSDAFPERGRISFLEGELVVDMSPEKFEVHSSLKAAVSSTIYFLIERGNLGFFFPDGNLLTNTEAEVSTEPDAMYLSRNSLRAGKAVMVEAQGSPGTHNELVGSPDWVLEVVSPSSPRKDKTLLRKAYHRAGVGEYWIIDARGKSIEFMMLVGGQRGYTEVKPVQGWRKSPTFNTSFRVTRTIDEDGFWHYTLHTKGRE